MTTPYTEEDVEAALKALRETWVSSAYESLEEARVRAILDTLIQRGWRKGE